LPEKKLRETKRLRVGPKTYSGVDLHVCLITALCKPVDIKLQSKFLTLPNYLQIIKCSPTEKVIFVFEK